MKLGIVWEVNAGKSTLFNRFFWWFRAIVTDIPGTTRENIIEVIKWSGLWDVELYDSPGLLNFKDEFSFIKDIIDTTDIILLVVDGNKDISPNIETIIDYIRKSNKLDKTVLVINKIDTNVRSMKENAMIPFYKFAIDKMFVVSAKHNINLVELKKEIEKLRKEKDIELFTQEEKDITPISFVGRVNVGKSTLFNSLIWQNFSAVSSISGTTLDYLTWEISKNRRDYKIFDTAGFRKKGKIHGLEKIAKDKIYSLIKIYNPIVVMLFDMEEGITHRDMTLIKDFTIQWANIIVALNKIDTFKEGQLKEYEKIFKNGMRFAPWIPLVFISGKEKQGFKDMFKMIDLLYENRNLKVATSQLNDLIQKAIIRNPPKFTKSRYVKFNYMTQTDDKTPTFICFVNNKEYVNFAFKRWVENIIRKEYWFIWIPIRLKFRNKNVDRFA